MKGTIYALRVIDSLSLNLATATAALSLAQTQGMQAYSGFTSVMVLGVVVGGLATFSLHNLVPTHLVTRTTPWVSAAARIALAAIAVGWFGSGLALLFTAGLLVAVTSVVITSMFHSLASVSEGSLNSRVRLLAATAAGALVGTLAAGAALEAGWTHVVVLVQLAGGLCGGVVARLYLKRYPGADPQREGLAESWRRIQPIAWRVPLIAGFSFTLGSLAPGLVTDARGPGMGALAAAAYTFGALSTGLFMGLGRGALAVRTGTWIRSHRQWFLPASLGSMLWMLITAHPVICMLAILLAGMILHLVQAGFEQAAADITGTQRAGPSIVALHSLAGASSAVVLLILPSVIATIGYVPTVAVASTVLILLATSDRFRPTYQRRARVEG